MLSPLRSTAASLSRRGAGYARPLLLQTIARHNVPFGCRSISCLTPRQTPAHHNVNHIQWQQVRFASSDAAQGEKPERKLSSLKSILRRFYLLTHPDKFAEFPAARLANEAALRDFMSYMEDYKKHPRGTPGGRMRKIPLTFYVRDEREGQVAQEPRKVTGELLVNASNPHAAKRRITQLFAACGLDGDFTFDHDVWMPPDTENLGEFLSSAVNHARESLKKASMHTTFVNATLSNIERKYSVRIGMSTGEDAYWSPSENREVAEKLEKLFQNLEVDGWINQGLMKGAEIGMDSENEQCAQDTSGRVYLSRKEGIEEWEEFLRHVNWSDVHLRRAKDIKARNDEARAKLASEDARSSKQEQLAKLLGVRKVDIKLYNSFEAQFSGDTKQPHKPLNDEWNEAEVEDFEKEAHATLDRLVTAKPLTQNKNNKLMKKLRNISLTFSPNMPPDRNYFIDRTGEIAVSTRLQAKELLDLLNDKIALVQELQREEQKYAAIRDFVEVRLGLKMLSMDYNYYHTNEDAVRRCNEATEKLQRASEKLRSLQLGGMTMAISDHYGLNLDGSLFIKWDFTDEEVILLLEGVQKETENTATEEKKDSNTQEEGQTEQGKREQSSSA